MIISTDTPISILKNLVDDSIGRLKIAGTFHLVVHHLAYKIVRIGTSLYTIYFHIPESMIHKNRSPRKASIGSRSKHIGSLSRT